MLCEDGLVGYEVKKNAESSFIVTSPQGNSYHIDKKGVKYVCDCSGFKYFIAVVKIDLLSSLYSFFYYAFSSSFKVIRYLQQVLI